MTEIALVLEKADELLATTEGALGVIRLNRPKALNALTLDMVRSMNSALKAVCGSNPGFEAVKLATTRSNLVKRRATGRPSLKSSDAWM